MGDFPSETVGNRELGGIPSSHREGFTSPSTHPPKGRVCPMHTCAHWCLSCARPQSPLEGRFYDSHFRNEVRCLTQTHLWKSGVRKNTLVVACLSL